MPAKDFYDILGVTRSATEKEIKAAYRKLARKYHPDVNPGDKKAEERFRDINLAYQVLSDKEKRPKYDQFGPDFEKYENMPPGYTAGGGGGGGGFPGGFGNGNFRVNVEDLGDLFGRAGRGGRGGGRIEDLVGNLFGGGGGFSAPHAPEPAEYDLDVTVEEAFSGTHKALELSLNEPCTTCGGMGQTARGQMCRTCGGRGARSTTQHLEVTVPSGVTEGTILRVPAGGTRTQDLHFKVKIRPHERWEVKGADIYTDVALTAPEAALGAEISFPTLKGTATMKIPPGTQSGQMFRLGGQGLPPFSGRKVGDLYVRARIVVPRSLTDEERKLYQELARLSHENPRMASR